MADPASRFRLVQFADDSALASAVAERWETELRARRNNVLPYCVALSGGRIARRFYSALAAKAETEPAWLDPVHFFWGDERCVAPEDPESNFGLAHSLLLEPLHIPAERIHRIRGEDPPETAAAAAATELLRVAQPGSNGQPVLDLVFLGMGEDGHVASLFPAEPFSTLADPAVFRAVTATKPPPRRITIGYPALAAARNVWVLASGAGKEAALRESLSPSGTTPLARLLAQRRNTLIFTDVAGSK